jgi:hypothetical protein
MRGGIQKKWAKRTKKDTTVKNLFLPFRGGLGAEKAEGEDAAFLGFSQSNSPRFSFRLSGSVRWSRWLVVDA